MDARWMPIVAAGVGVLGGIGGAFIGGYLANEGAEGRFEKERAAAEQDLRREAYGAYLGTAQEVWATFLANAEELQPADESDAAQDAAAHAQEEIDAAGVRLFVAQARVRLVAENDEVEDAAVRLREVLVDGEGTDYPLEEGQEQKKDLEEATKGFLAAAQEDIGG
jgi:hypothetical protein